MLPLLFLLLLGLPAPAQELSARAEFHTLWWSKEQMSHFDPNKPPPKQTEVLIDRWEYTDPVGVPHPDEIMAHVLVRNKGEKASAPVQVIVQVRWKEGSQKSSKSAIWGPARLVKTVQLKPVPARGESSFTVPVALAPRMNQLEKRGRWPYELELIVIGRSSGAPAFRYVRPFPIRRGD